MAMKSHRSNQLNSLLLTDEKLSWRGLSELVSRKRTKPFGFVLFALLSLSVRRQALNCRMTYYYL